MSATTKLMRSKAAARKEMCGRVKEMLVERLALDVEPGLVTDDQPLFGRGLELDSIDSLELAVAINDEFGVVITDDNIAALMSVNRIVDYVERELA